MFFTRKRVSNFYIQIIIFFINLMNRDICHIKLVTMGPLSSGKTCLIKRYCEEDYEPCYIPTIGVDYGIKYFDTSIG